MSANKPSESEVLEAAIHWLNSLLPDIYDRLNGMDKPQLIQFAVVSINRIAIILNGGDFKDLDEASARIKESTTLLFNAYELATRD